MSPAQVLPTLFRPTTAAGRLAAILALTASASVLAQTTAPAIDRTELPEMIRAALARARIDPGSFYAWVAPIDGGPARLAHQAAAPAQPASVMKVVTSMAALERLGPVFQWRTLIYREGDNLYLRGGGDPRLVNERTWLMLRRAMDVTGPDLRGDIVLDRSGFAVPPVDPGAFDNEPLQPYNVQPDALMINQKSVVLSWRPEPARGEARLSVDTPLAGVQWPVSVTLGRGACQNWRAALAIDLTDPARPRFRGSYPASCGDREWPLAFPDPASFNARAIEAQWQALGGRLQGQVREGRVPPGLPPLAAWPSPSLPDVLRDMNKHSNNMVAQHVMLALSPGQPDTPATFEAARAEVQRLVQAQGCREDELVIDNGSGLSRQERVSARCLGRLLQWAWMRPWMPELLGSLPVAGIETTARRLTSAAGRAHIKTGTLGNVVAIGGVVDDASGRRHAVVAMINHPLAGSPDSRAVLDTVLRWALKDAVVSAAPATEPEAPPPEVRTDCCEPG